MATIVRHTAVWTGTPGLPGYSQFYQETTGGVAAAAQIGHTALDSFFYSLGTLIPDDINVVVDPVYQVIDDVTGEISSEGTVGTPGAGVGGSYVGGWQRQVGVLVEWTTGLFLNGARFRGRTYLVPLGSVAETDGSLPVGTINSVETAADFILDADPNFVVWHRPVNSANGLSQPITGAVIRDHAAVLRSRMV